MPHPRRLWLLLILALLLGYAPAARAQEEKLYRPELTAKHFDNLLRTEWYGVYLKNDKTGKDDKIGYVRSERKRVGDRIIDNSSTALKLLSFKQKTELSTLDTRTFEAAAPYRLLSAKNVVKNGPIEIKTALTWNADKGGYEFVHEVGGEKRTELRKDIDYTLADAWATEVWVQQGPKVGDTIVSRSFDAEQQKMDLQTDKLLSSKRSLVEGVDVRFFEVESVSKLRQLPQINRYDDQGVALSARIAIFELRRESEEQAKDTKYSQDLFVLGLAKLDKGLGQTDKLTELVIEVDGKEAGVFEDGPRQSVIAGDNGNRLVKLGKKYGKEQKATDAEIKEALAETNNYPISHPKIKKLAEEAIAGAKSDAEKVEKLVAFVHEFVKPSLSADTPNIHNLLEKKKGDCKSYALLFNNLARAAGVPAREVSGLVYCGDEVKAFGGHAWNEVVLGGVWVPIDASRGQTEVDVTHISFGTEHRAAKNLLSSLGKLSFKLISAE
jgi:transglutaminase-like putative cysteine protease